MLKDGAKLFLSVVFSGSPILGSKELVVQVKMTRRKTDWVSKSSGDHVNLGFDRDDDMVSGLSYVSRYFWR